MPSFSSASKMAETTAPNASAAEPDADRLYTDGVRALDRGQFEEAVELLASAVEKKVAAHGEKAPACGKAYLRYGEALFYKAQEVSLDGARRRRRGGAIPRHKCGPRALPGAGKGRRAAIAAHRCGIRRSGRGGAAPRPRARSARGGPSPRARWDSGKGQQAATAALRCNNRRRWKRRQWL